MEATECGAASLAIVLAHHGRFVPLAELRLACGVSRSGPKASNILRAAQAYGLEAKGYKKEVAQLQELPLPAVVFWNFTHFLVLEGYGAGAAGEPGRYYLNDPASGPRTVSAQEFEESFSDIVLTLTPGPDFRKGGEKPSILAALARRLDGSKPVVAYALLAGAALVLPGLVVPTFARLFVDQVLVKRSESWFRPLVLGLILTAVLRGALTLLQRRALLRLETKIAAVTSAKFVWHVLRLPIEYYNQRYAGEVAGRVALNAQIAVFLASRLASAAIDVLLLVFYALLMLSYDPALTAITLFAVALVGAATAMVNRMRIDGFRRVLQEQGKSNGTLTAGIATIEGLKATGTESDFFARWAGYQAKAVNALQEVNRLSHLFLTAPAFVVTVANAAVLTLGGYRVAQGRMTMGMLVAFQSLAASFFLPVTNLVGLFGKLQVAEGQMNRIDDVLQAELDPELLREEDGADPGQRLEGRLEFRDVTFGYSRMDEPLLTRLNFTLAPGSRVAVIGPSGCGKSTVARLIAGQYQPWQGDVLLDDRPRAGHPRAVLSSSVAVVDQDIALFEGTIRDNLTLWDSTAPDAAVVKACKDACIHDDIAIREGGYDSGVSEGGANFSGGQRQRLEIARALVLDPQILVLDEATSALDSVTEREIDRNLRRRGCTCVIIAHRLSTIRDADEIIVLRKGHVVQRGTHDELMQDAGGDYALLAGEG